VIVAWVVWTEEAFTILTVKVSVGATSALIHIETRPASSSVKVGPVRVFTPPLALWVSFSEKL
jgi:hypothetical protein